MFKYKMGYVYVSGQRVKVSNTVLKMLRIKSGASINDKQYEDIYNKTQEYEPTFKKLVASEFKNKDKSRKKLN